MPVQPSVIRAEIAEVLQAGRLTRLVSVESQVFRLVDSKWHELAPEPTLVHLIHDHLEGVTKMLAVSNLQVIINNVPVSSNFSLHAPSKKFIHFVSNKFDKNSENYGFGFTDPTELELFYHKLTFIRSAAMASLTPSFHLGAPSSPASAHRNTRRSVVSRVSLGGSTSSPSLIEPPFGFIASPMRHTTHHINKIDSTSSLYQLNQYQPNVAYAGQDDDSNIRSVLSESSSLMSGPLTSRLYRAESTDTYCTGPQEDVVDGSSMGIFSQSAKCAEYVSSLTLNDRPQGESTPIATPDAVEEFFSFAKSICEDQALEPYKEVPTSASDSALTDSAASGMKSDNDDGDLVGKITKYDNDDGDLLSFTERRLRDLISSFDVTSPTQEDQGNDVAAKSKYSFAGNPAGAIGTPIKGLLSQ